MGTVTLCLRLSIVLLVLVAIGSMMHEYFFTQKGNRSFFELDDVRHETITISALTAVGGFVAARYCIKRETPSENST